MRHLVLPTLVVFCMGGAWLACAPDSATQRADVHEAAVETAIGDDPAFVMRGRVLFQGPGSQKVAFEAEPFSHRGRKWHVYPMTVYPGAAIGARLHVVDKRMFGAAEVRLYGPARADGTWGTPKIVSTGADGTAVLGATELVYGRYAVVVGPAKGDGFLARYPSDVAIMRPIEGGADGNASVAVFMYERKDGELRLDTEQNSYRIVSPKPSTHADADPVPGADFKLEDAAGQSATFRLETWSLSDYFVEEGSGDHEGVVGNLDGVAKGMLDLDPVGAPEKDFRYLVLESVGLGPDALLQPLLLRTVPETLGGRQLALVPRSECAANMSCNNAVYADDGSKVAAGDVLANIRSFKRTFFDLGEDSTYNLEVSCEKGCTPPHASDVKPTRYPIYYAHGFNSSKDCWKGLFADYLDGIPGFVPWRDAASVPGFMPVPPRADALRRNVRRFLLEAEAERGAPPGEPFLRLNIVAHSMGGLDSRWLVGHPAFNEECEQGACVGDDGAPESCCAPPDAFGEPTTWRERVASITTLSTPHAGSSFASWGLESMASSKLFSSGFELVAKKYLGLDEAGQALLKGTLVALSQEWSASDMTPGFPVPDPTRSYAWDCAIGRVSGCKPPSGSDLPVWAGSEPLLPGPKEGLPTIFSWAGLSCVTGSCGDVLDPGLLPAYAVVKAREGDNDGVVSVKSAGFGIFMGVMPYDHFDWTMTSGPSATQKAATWLFGVRKEPTDRFHVHWIERLRSAGY